MNSKVGVVDVGGDYRGIYAAANSPMRFLVVATETETGKAKYFDMGDIQ